MAVSSRDFLNSANTFSDENNEMQLRNKISRAYYSAYSLAKSTQSDKNYKPHGVRGGVHAQLIEYYSSGADKQLDKKTQNQIAGILSTVKVLRVKADYKLNLSIPCSDGAVSVALAEAAHEILEKN